MHVLFLGVTLGIGASLPIGPVNLEMIRRNLYCGFNYGLAVGLGACAADITYLILLCAGVLTLLQYPDILKIIGFLGSFVLLWFGITALRANRFISDKKHSSPSLWKFGLDGYLITLINPYTILFWASVSALLPTTGSAESHALWLLGVGIIFGLISWVILLNCLVHKTRHRLNAAVMRWLNMVGGVVILGFAGLGFINILG